MPEQFRFQQRFRQGTAVHGDKHALGPRAPVVNGAGHKFLSCAALPKDENRRVARRDLLDKSDHLAHGAAGVKDHPLELGRLADRSFVPALIGIHVTRAGREGPDLRFILFHFREEFISVFLGSFRLAVRQFLFKHRDLRFAIMQLFENDVLLPFKIPDLISHSLLPQEETGGCGHESGSKRSGHGKNDPSSREEKERREENEHGGGGQRQEAGYSTECEGGRGGTTSRDSRQQQYRPPRCLHKETVGQRVVEKGGMKSDRGQLRVDGRLHKLTPPLRDDADEDDLPAERGHGNRGSTSGT